jgi:hypothetical protein
MQQAKRSKSQDGRLTLGWRNDGMRYRVQSGTPAISGENRIVVEVANTPGKAMDDPEHLAYLAENKFSNTYFERCREFEGLSPDEEPLAHACLIPVNVTSPPGSLSNKTARSRDQM